MNLKQLLERTRILADDHAGAVLWSDAFLTEQLNLAEREACIRAQLLEEIETPRCRITLVEDQRIYPLDRLVIDVTRCRRTGQSCDMERLAFENVTFPARSGHQPTGYAVKGDPTEDAGPQLILDRAAPDQSAQQHYLDLAIYRLPQYDMEVDDDEPEIGLMHHDALPFWALHLAYSCRDYDAEDKGRANEFAGRFEARFGMRVDANVARKQRRHRAPVCRMNYP